MKKAYLFLTLLAGLPLLGLALAGPVDGQKVAGTKTALVTPGYDISREITVQGTVASIVTNPPAGLPAGAHALVATSSGTVDAHLGIYALRGTAALKLAAGDQVRMAGVMVSIKGQQVLLVRTIQTAGGLIVIRNPHGILLRSASATATRPQREDKEGRP
jgi:hypothetical protein